jgi:YggT family protein
MATFLGLYALLVRGVQLVCVAAAVVMGIAAAVDWLVRTRRITPFSAVARFTRRTIDPLLAPVERRVLRSGGSPTNVPWWGLVAVVVGGIVLISLLQFIGGQMVALHYAARGGARGMLVFAVGAAFSIAQIAIMVRVIASWIPSLSPYSPWLRWAFVISEPILAPLRRIIPPLGMVDISPLVAYFGLGFLQGVVMNLLR